MAALETQKKDSVIEEDTMQHAKASGKYKDKDAQELEEEELHDEGH